MKNYRIVDRNHDGDWKYSILIPTWNNLACLQLVLRSLETHSTFRHQIIVMINEGKDSTAEWVHNNTNYDYIYAEENLGVCFGLNLCRSLVKCPYIVYMNDDMYALPCWDLELDREVQAIGHNWFYLSSTMIEPGTSDNNCVIRADYGRDPGSLREDKLLQEFRSFEFHDWQGSTWPPNILHRDLWDLVGGMSIEFSPGMYSDPDFSRKLWLVGVRFFKGVAASRVYHFGAKTTKRIKHNLGRDMFIRKWGMSAGTFTKSFLRRGERFDGPLQEPVVDVSKLWENKLKAVLSSLR